MTDPLPHILFILLAWLVQTAVPSRGRALVLPLSGLLFLLAFAPVSAVWIAFMCLEACVIFLICRRFGRKSALRKYLPYAILPNFLFVDLHGVFFQVFVETLAISFSTIRVFMTTKQLLGSRNDESLTQTGWIFAAAFFLPALIVGPVFSGTDLRKNSRNPGSVGFELRDARMILQGYVMAGFVNPALGGWALEFREFSDLPNFAMAPVYFLQLFLAFWGQSLIAEHASRLFGYKLPQNFDKPWRAKDIKEFWARWHRSMARFIMQYLYLPLSINGVPPKLATIVAFTFMGVWHNTSLGYLIWGIAHGMLMTMWKTDALYSKSRVISRVLTFSAVISLSFIANFGPLS